MSQSAWRRAFVVWALIQSFALVVSFGLGLPGSMPPELQGSWKRHDDALLDIQPRRILLYEDGRLAVRRVLDYRDGSAVLRKSGLAESWLLSLRGDTLRIKRQPEGVELVYVRLKEAPPELRLEPFPIGKPIPLD